MRANSLSTSFVDCARTRYMHIATGTAEYERELRPRAEKAKYLQNYARLVNSDFTKTFCVTLLLRPRMETTFLDWSSAIRPHENRGNVESDSICIRKSQTPKKSRLSIHGRNLSYTRIVHDALQLFTYSLPVDILHFLCSCCKRSHL